MLGNHMHPCVSWLLVLCIHVCVLVCVCVCIDKKRCSKSFNGSMKRCAPAAAATGADGCVPCYFFHRP
uniref:Uncharacterized protein n=1 Tax=Anopheles darlingi TaxID=43151 RepID=A0A2M4DBB8_ANODA